MSRLKCDCGKILYSTSDDTRNILAIYDIQKVNNAISNNENERFADFECDNVNEEYEYWYCDDCKRIKKQSFKTGLVVETYIFGGEIEMKEIPSDAVFILSEKESVDIDFNGETLLKDVIQKEFTNHIYLFDEHAKTYSKIII